VAEVAAALDNADVRDARSVFDPAQMEAANVYPSGSCEDEDPDELLGDVQKLRAFYQAATKARRAVVIHRYQ
jgi:hypothetical protein